MRQVLEVADTTSKTWAGVTGDLYILLSGNVSGTWKLEELDPDGGWVDISPMSGGMTEAGGWWYKSRAATRYRLDGGNAGAKAWVTNANGIELELFD